MESVTRTIRSFVDYCVFVTYVVALKNFVIETC